MRFVFFFILHLVSLPAMGEDKIKRKSFAARAGLQLGSGGFSYFAAAEIGIKHSIHIGVKFPFSSETYTGTFPAGIIAGYNYPLLENKNWQMKILADVQWYSAQTRNLIKPAHHIDATLNYCLFFSKLKRMHFYSSFGYGVFLKYFYPAGENKLNTASGMSGLIQAGIRYNF